MGAEGQGLGWTGSLGQCKHLGWTGHEVLAGAQEQQPIPRATEHDGRQLEKEECVSMYNRYILYR